MGKVVLEQQLKGDVNQIAVNKLTPGTYIIKLETTTGTSETGKFVKQ